MAGLDQPSEHIAAGEHRHGAHQCYRCLEHHRAWGVIARRQQMGHRLHKHAAQQQHHGKSNTQHITSIENSIEHPRRQIPQQQYRADGEKRNLNKNHLFVLFFVFLL